MRRLRKTAAPLSSMRQNLRFLSNNNNPPFSSGRRQHLRLRPDQNRPDYSMPRFSRVHIRTFSTNPIPSLIDNHDADMSSEKYDEQLEREIELFTSSCLPSFAPDFPDLEEVENEIDEVIEEGNAALRLELGEEAESGMEWDEDYFHEENFDFKENGEEKASPSDARTPVQTESERRKMVQKSAMEILRNFDQHNPPSRSDPEELQLWLECAAQRDAVLRYQNLVQKARDRKAYDSMSLMQRHLIKWFEGMRDAVEVRQKEYLSNKDTRRGRKRYGPFLCALPPEKMAVIASHEAMTHALQFSGKTGREGIPLVKMAHAIGVAVETEVISQRRMRERFHDQRVKNSTETAEDDNEKNVEEGDIEDPKVNNSAADRWKFSASHLKLFIAELQRIDPKMGKSKRSITYAMLRAKQAMNSEEGWTDDDVIHLGAALLSILIETTVITNKGREEPAFRVEKKWTPKRKTTSYVVLNENLYRMFTEDELMSWAASTTRHAPMIVPPTEWTGPQSGGYRWLEADLMRTHGSQMQREALRHGDLSLVYEGLNILGKTAWRINHEILDIANTCWANNIPIGDIPSRTDLEVPPEPTRPDRIPREIYADKESPEAREAIAANQRYRESVYKRQRILQKNMDLRSLRCSAMLKLNQAGEFKDYEKIYFPYNLDFRGRACKFGQCGCICCLCLCCSSSSDVDFFCRPCTTPSVNGWVRSVPRHAEICRSKATRKTRPLLAKSSPCQLRRERQDVVRRSGKVC